MNCEAIVNALECFEREHPVESFEAFDMRVWPVLRNWLGFQLVWQKPPSARVSGWTVLRKKGLSFFSLLWNSLRFRMLERDNRFGLGRDSKSSPDVVVLTDSNRCFLREGRLFHYIADPAVREFDRLGMSAQIWDLGKEGEKSRGMEPVWLRRRLDTEIRRRLSLAKVSGEFSQWEKMEPAWFEPFGVWAVGLLGRPIGWAEVAARLRYVCLVARVFEEWLGKARPRFLVVDCWYGLTTMGAILAASRLGICSMDIQHGLQSVSEFAYSCWTKAPSEGYGCFPDAFWVWGRQNVRELYAHNSPVLVREGRVVSCGNLWINQCRYHADGVLQQEIQELKRLTAGYSRVLLVTLQPSQGVEEAVWPAIQNSPEDVFWFVRLHPRMSDGEKRRIEQMVQDMGGRVNVSDASRVSLYALLQVAGIHLTGFSTCALEALAFGKPTVLVHPSGFVLFREQIEQGVMIFEPQREGVWIAVENARTISPEACLEAGNGFFASEAESLEGIRRMFRVE
jgi:hypothetical protein